MQGKKETFYDRFRSNQDVFLGCILNDPEFSRIKEEILGDLAPATWFFKILGDRNSDNDKKVVKSCAEAIASHFRIKESTALKLILTSKHIADLHFGYVPRCHREDDQIHITIGPKTTLEDIRRYWPFIKDKQKEIGKTHNRKSTNPELAYCIHKQIMSGKKLKQAFDLYIDGKLEGYDHKPTLLEFNDFRKYYSKIVKEL